MISLIRETVSASQELSVRLRMEDMIMSTAILMITRQMTTAAMGSRMGRPMRAPAMPIRLPMEERASER